EAGREHAREAAPGALSARALIRAVWASVRAGDAYLECLVKEWVRRPGSAASPGGSRLQSMGASSSHSRSSPGSAEGLPPAEGSSSHFSMMVRQWGTPAGARVLLASKPKAW